MIIRHQKLFTALTVSAIIIAPFCFFIFETEADPSPGPPTVVLTETITPEEILPAGQARITLAVRGEGDRQQRFEPVDVMHLIDVSGSMGWFGNVVSEDNGFLTSDWKKVRMFQADSQLTEFDVLLYTGLTGNDQFLRIKSPTGRWYGYQKTNSSCVTYTHLQFPGSDYLRVQPRCAEPGAWEVWAKGEVSRSYTLAISRPPSRLQAAQEAAKHFVSLMQNQDQIGLVVFNGAASLKQPLILIANQSSRDLINAKIDSLSASGATAIGKGIAQAVAYLEAKQGGRAGVAKTIVLLSDGRETENSDPIGQAQKAKLAGIKIYAIGLGQADENLLAQIANLTAGQYFKADSASSLQAIYNQIARGFSSAAAKNGQLRAVLPDYVEYLGNASQPLTSLISNPDGTTQLVWQPISLEIGQSKQISFDVKVHRASGRHRISVYPETKFDFTDYQGQAQSLSFPETLVQIISQIQVDLTKAAQPAGIVSPGEEITYQISYRHSGPASTTLDLVDTWSFGSQAVASYVSGSASNAYGQIAPQINEAQQTISWSSIVLPPQVSEQTITLKLKTKAISQNAGTFTIKNTVTAIINSEQFVAKSVENQVAYPAIPAPSASPLPSLPLASVSGSGGVGGFMPGLIISQEQATELTEQSANLSWYTNLLASCRVIYDAISHEPNVVYGGDFGYRQTVKKSIASPAIFHSFKITGASASSTYYWRAACRRSGEVLETVSAEQRFTTLPAAALVSSIQPSAVSPAELIKPIVKGIVKTLPTSSLPTSLPVVTSSPEATSSAGEATVTSSPVAAKTSVLASSGAFWGFLVRDWPFWLFLILLIMLILILLSLRRRDRNSRQFH